MRNACHWWLFTLFLVLILGIPAAAQTGPQQDSRIFRTEPMGNGYVRTGVNTAIFRGSSLVTSESTQYAAFYDEQGRFVLARRTLGSPRWDAQVTRYTGNVLDVHNVISLGIDGKGVLRAAWDHHNHPLNYCQSTKLSSLELTDKLSMTDQERAVCYPQFFRLPDGDLLFLYRTGMSGAGDLGINRYDVKTGQWSALPGPIVAGEGQRNAYWQTAIDPRSGAIHLSWCWRERKGNADLLTNHDICYAWRSENRLRPHAGFPYCGTGPAWILALADGRWAGQPLAGRRAAVLVRREVRPCAGPAGARTPG
jgi:hypothetical protein